jgi:hypothetical protein
MKALVQATETFLDGSNDKTSREAISLYTLTSKKFFPWTNGVPSDPNEVLSIMGIPKSLVSDVHYLISGNGRVLVATYNNETQLVVNVTPIEE